MNRMTVVYHMALARPDGMVVASRVGEARRGGAVVSGTTQRIALTPDEARRMAKAMRDTHGRFLKEDGGDTVEVWCEEYEAYQIIWISKDGTEVSEHINCCESDGDGWSWEFAQALDEAACEAEEGERRIWPPFGSTYK